MSQIHYVVNPVVSCRDEEDGSVLFNPDTDDMAIINPTGRVIWDFLCTPRTTTQIVAHLVEHFRGVSTEQAGADVEEFLQSLLPDYIVETLLTDES